MVGSRFGYLETKGCRDTRVKAEVGRSYSCRRIREGAVSQQLSIPRENERTFKATSRQKVTTLAISKEDVKREKKIKRQIGSEKWSTNIRCTHASEKKVFDLRCRLDARVLLQGREDCNRAFPRVRVKGHFAHLTAEQCEGDRVDLMVGPASRPRPRCTLLR